MKEKKIGKVLLWILFSPFIFLKTIIFSLFELLEKAVVKCGLVSVFNRFRDWVLKKIY